MKSIVEELPLLEARPAEPEPDWDALNAELVSEYVSGMLE